MPPARVKRVRGGRFALRITGAERDVLRSLPAQLRQMLTGQDSATDPDLRRLFPPAYPDDPQKSAEYDGMVRDDLMAERIAAIEVMERTIDSDSLSEDELLAWLSAINDLRLVLGTRLDVPEDLSRRAFLKALTPAVRLRAAGATGAAIGRSATPRP